MFGICCKLVVEVYEYEEYVYAFREEGQLLPVLLEYRLLS